MIGRATGHFTISIHQAEDLNIIDRLAFVLPPSRDDYEERFINLDGESDKYGSGWVRIRTGTYTTATDTYDYAQFLFDGRYFFVLYDNKQEVIAPEQVSLRQRDRVISLSKIAANFTPIPELHYRLLNNLDRVNRDLQLEMSEAFRNWNWEANISLNDGPMPVSKLFVTIDGTRLCFRPPYFARQLAEDSLLFEDLIIESNPHGFEPEVPFKAFDDIFFDGFVFFHEKLLKGELMGYREVFTSLLYDEEPGQAEKEFEAYLLFFGYFGLKFYSESFRRASQPVVYDFAPGAVEEQKM